MNRLLYSALLILLLIACNGKAGDAASEREPKEELAIGIQPLDFNDPETLDSLSEYIREYLGARVVVLKNTSIPETFKNTTKGPRYSSDSIISHLRKTIPDDLDIIVGITGKDIFTTKRDETGAIKEPRYKYEVWGIFGLGYMPGKSCVVSNYRLKTTDPAKTLKRMRNVVIHEIGHNLGLDHCENQQCIMTDANESIATVDNSSDRLCDSCTAKTRKHSNQP